MSLSFHYMRIEDAPNGRIVCACPIGEDHDESEFEER